MRLSPPVTVDDMRLPWSSTAGAKSLLAPSNIGAPISRGQRGLAAAPVCCSLPTDPTCAALLLQLSAVPGLLGVVIPSSEAGWDAGRVFARSSRETEYFMPSMSPKGIISILTVPRRSALSRSHLHGFVFRQLHMYSVYTHMNLYIKWVWLLTLPSPRTRVLAGDRPPLPTDPRAAAIPP